MTRPNHPTGFRDNRRRKATRRPVAPLSDRLELAHGLRSLSVRRGHSDITGADLQPFRATTRGK